MGESEIDEVGVIATSWWYVTEEKFNVEKSVVCIGSQEMGSDVPATCSLPTDCHVICNVIKQVRLRSHCIIPQEVISKAEIFSSRYYNRTNYVSSIKVQPYQVIWST